MNDRRPEGAEIGGALQALGDDSFIYHGIKMLDLSDSSDGSMKDQLNLKPINAIRPFRGAVGKEMTYVWNCGCCRPA